MTNNYVVTNSRNWRQGSGLGSDDNLTRRRWKRFSGEEGGSFVLGDGVGVEVVAGAGQAGHGVAGGGAHAPLCQMKSETFIFQRNSQKNSSLTDLNCSK